MSYKLSILIQSRMGSSRFPGKSLSKIGDYNLLERIINSLLTVYKKEQIYVLTSTKEKDIEIVKVANRVGVKSLTGDEDNVASRFKTAIEKEASTHFFRICGDSPFFLPSLVKRADLLAQKNPMLDFVSSKPSKSHPQGQNIELFNASTFLNQYSNFTNKGHFEHVTTYFYENMTKFNYIALSSKINNFDYAATNFSVDTKDNLETMTKLYKAMEKPHYLYTVKELYNLYKEINK